MREINNLIQEIEELCKPLLDGQHHFEWISKVYKVRWYISLDFNDNWNINITKSSSGIKYTSNQPITWKKYWIDLLKQKKDAIRQIIQEKLEIIKRDTEKRELAILEELKLKYEKK